MKSVKRNRFFFEKSQVMVQGETIDFGDLRLYMKTKYNCELKNSVDCCTLAFICIRRGEF